VWKLFKYRENFIPEKMTKPPKTVVVKEAVVDSYEKTCKDLYREYDTNGDSLIQ